MGPVTRQRLNPKFEGKFTFALNHKDKPLITKMIEIRDSMTCIAALAIQMIPTDDVEKRFMKRCGFPKDGSSIVLMCLDNQAATNDPYEWGSLGKGGRTFQTAHHWILRHFTEIQSGDVVDVQYILDETKAPKTPEII